MADAIRAHTTLPEFPKGVSIEEAYEALPMIAESVCDQSVVGIKAGLTNPDVLGMFGLTEPLLGYLYDWGEAINGDSLPCHDHAQIECEISIFVDADGTPIALAPAVEFVRVAFSDMTDFTPANLIMCSLGADRFILGDKKPWADTTLDALDDVVITLKKDGSEILRTTPTDSLGGPRSAVRWGLGEARKRNMLLHKNMVLLGGTCGSGVPLETGSYVVEYGSFGQITFEVVSDQR